MNAPSSSDPLVVVTGASGFIALHCIRELLESGYRVRGTVRTADKQRAAQDALKDVPGSAERLSFAVADLTADAGWQDLMQGAEGVLHTACPVPLAPPDDENEVVIPARDGTLRVLRAAQRAGVKRVVMTSSIAAIVSGHPHDPGRLFSEQDWSEVTNRTQPYPKGKMLAERAAWEFVEQHPGAFELVTVNPAFVLGPALGGANNASNEAVRKLLDREVPGVPRLMLPTVDVRDVASAHLLALTSDKAPGQRFILSSEDTWFRDIGMFLKEAGYHVPTRIVPGWVVRGFSWFDKTARLIVDEVGWEFHLNTENARQRLGWKPRPARTTVLDTARSILARRAAG